jgi:hypothetical protein
MTTLLFNSEIDEAANETKYRLLIGALLYIAGSTRPDIMYSVSLLSKYLCAPGIRHYYMALNNLRYLHTTKEFGLCYGKSTKSNYEFPEISFYCDADLGGQEALTDSKRPCNCRSTMGIKLLFGQNIIAFKSKKQFCIARSSTESELYSIGAGVTLLQFIKKLLNEIFVDSQERKTIKLYSEQS